MVWVLIYISTNFLAPIPLISLGFVDFLSQFPPKSTNSSRRISRKVTNWLKPDLGPAKAGTPAKAGPSPAKAGPANQRNRPLRGSASLLNGLLPRSPSLSLHRDGRLPARPSKLGRTTPRSALAALPLAPARPGRSRAALWPQQLEPAQLGRSKFCQPHALAPGLAPSLLGCPTHHRPPAGPAPLANVFHRRANARRGRQLAPPGTRTGPASPTPRAHAHARSRPTAQCLPHPTCSAHQYAHTAPGQQLRPQHTHPARPAARAHTSANIRCLDSDRK
jgi:hypothetical protein